MLNLKTFPTALGRGAVRLARDLATVSAANGFASAIAPATPDLAAVARAVRIPVLAQHVDPLGPGPTTGFVPAAAVKTVGARGSLVNHSEHPLPFAVVKGVCATLREVGLTAVVCARDPRAARSLASLRPDYVAVEPPELIGGKRSVSTARPEVVVAGVSGVHAVSPRTRVLCGAGIHDRTDVRKALELGAEGVLVASAVVLAPRPRAVLEDLLGGFR